MTRETVTMAVMFLMSIAFGITDYFKTETINIITVVLFVCSVLYFVLLIKEKGFDMFGWRKRQIADAVEKDVGLPEPTELTPVPEVVEPVEPEEFFDASDASYTIGKNKGGNIQMRLRLETGSATLTLAPDAVVELIQQLAVNITKHYSVEITYAGQEDDVEDQGTLQ